MRSLLGCQWGEMPVGWSTYECCEASLSPKEGGAKDAYDVCGLVSGSEPTTNIEVACTHA